MRSGTGTVLALGEIMPISLLVASSDEHFRETIRENLKAVKIKLDDATYQLGPTLEFDPKAEKFVNHAAANELLTRKYRAPFVVPDSGHEGCQIGSAWPFRRGHDVFVPYYRDMGICLVAGMTPRDVFLGVFGKKDDPSSGGRSVTSAPSTQGGICGEGATLSHTSRYAARRSRLTAAGQLDVGWTGSEGQKPVRASGQGPRHPLRG